MIKHTKKGISAIVATVLIILITVAAVTIIWSAIIPLVSNQLEKGSSCLDAIQEVTLGTSGFTCYNTNANVLRVQVKRGPNEIDLTNVQFIVGDSQGNTVTFDNASVEVTGGAMPGVNGAKVFSIDVTNIAGAVSSISIAPVIGFGGSEEICDAASVLAQIPAC